MTTQIKPSSFWDDGPGNVRCSSTGEAASQYLDPNTQNLEGNDGRPVGSLLPRSGGLGGVVIPRATSLGGSRGFDANKPTLVNIDPDIKGQSCVVDFSKITKEQMEEAYKQAGENPLISDDLRLRAAQTFHNLAVGYEPVGMSSAGPRATTKQAPPRGFSGAYVTPKASLGGGQLAEEELPTLTQSKELSSPSIQPRLPIIKPTPVKLPNVFDKPTQNLPIASGISTSSVPYLDGQPAFSISPTSVPLRADVDRTPTTKVTFEMAGWGTFEAVYHKVIQSAELLILAFDTQYTAGMRYFPPANEKSMKVTVNGASFMVACFGNKFEHNGFEYGLLVIEQTL